jgi:hypothetical protein
VWALVAAVVLSLFGFFPIVNWIRGGRAWPRFGVDLEGWLAGTAISVGAGVLYLILARRVPALWRDDALSPLVRTWDRRPRAGNTLLALIALVVYVCSAWYVFSGRPLLVDEVLQLYQARLFASGRIAGTVDSAQELFSALFQVERNGRVFSQFPPGGPAVLALGVLIGATWLIVPLCGAFTVWCFAALARHRARSTRRVAARIRAVRVRALHDLHVGFADEPRPNAARHRRRVVRGRACDCA